ncbi:MAG: response regulator transcription factor [Deltaproteobacteria bacterium]|nr:response regulator transcription factor [Deltaproteobacteria bacterium]
MNPIRILLVDDHHLVRAGLRTLLQQMVGAEVIGEASDGREALEKIKADPPDVVLMDITMAEMNGLVATAQVTHDFPHVRVVMLSMHANKEYVTQALQAGAAGYLLKDAAPTELELAIRAVMRGEKYLSPAISTHVIADYLQRSAGGTLHRTEVETSPHDPLTLRQREILQLIAEGNTTKEIAAKLTLSVKTVETHRTQLMERLDIHDIAGLVRYAIRTGLVTPDR